MFWRMRSVVFSGNLPQRAGPLDLGFIAYHAWDRRQNPTEGGAGPARKENVRTWLKRWF